MHTSKLRLCDKIIENIAPLMAAFEGGPTSKDLASYFDVDQPSCRSAIDELFKSGSATYCRRGNTIHLLPINWTGPICKVCRAEFQRKGKSKRLTCSRTCQIKLGWREPEKRLAALREIWASPEWSQRAQKINVKRWARDGEREKLSERTKKVWADPVEKIKMSAAIAKVQRSDERRQFQSEQIKARWDDANGRQKLVDGIKESKSTPEARAKFSRLLKERWEDPEMREKYTRANRARNDVRFAKK